MEWFVDLMWWILGWFGFHLPDDLPSYSTFVRAEWYYQAIPGFTAIGIGAVVVGIIQASLYISENRKVKKRQIEEAQRHSDL